MVISMSNTNGSVQFSFEKEDYPMEAAGGQQLYHIKYFLLIKHSRLDFFSYQPNSLLNDLVRIGTCYTWKKVTVLNSIWYIDDQYVEDHLASKLDHNFVLSQDAFVERNAPLLFF